MKNSFRGWTSVYAFTFRQATKGLNFKITTAVITFLIFAGFVVMNVVVAKESMKDKNEPLPIKSVYLLDNSGLQPTNYKEIFSQLEGNQFKHIKFVTLNSASNEVIKTAASDSTEAIAVIISMQDSSYELKAVIPENSKIKKKHAEDLLEPMSAAFKANKLFQSGLSPEQLTKVLKPTVASLSKIGESTDNITKIIKMVTPMVFSFILYFMLLIYGQTVSKSVSTEKTSKLVEVLLTSVHPYALITGKVLAMTSAALGQFVIWIAAAIAGLYGGNTVAKVFYPQFENSTITIINFVRDNIGETALTLPALILGIIIFCFGFLFYNTISAVSGCMVSKPEEVASTQAIFQFPIITSWLVSYFAPIIGNNVLLMVVRYFPFTSPFSVPVDLITGTIGMAEGILALALLLVFSLLTIILAARVYKGLVLYNGQKLNLKAIGNILKTNK